MSHVVYCWENGASQGHVAPARPVLAELPRRGHAVSAAVKDMRPAAAAFADLGVRCYLAPLHHGKPPAESTSARVVWQLEAAGLGNPAASGPAYQAWRSMFRLLEPDFALLDYSPLATLALRDSRTRAAQFGTGICCPPSRTVLWSGDAEPDGTSPSDDQLRVLGTMNSLLRAGEQREIG